MIKKIQFISYLSFNRYFAKYLKSKTYQFKNMVKVFFSDFNQPPWCFVVRKVVFKKQKVMLYIKYINKI
jgi:hypothetical protein